MAQFYFPLTLGIRRRRVQAPERADAPPRYTYDSWREGAQRPQEEYEEHPEARVLEALQQSPSAASTRYWVILGEPGAGKTTLLDDWFVRWAHSLDAPCLGMRVLVRLRELEAADLKLEGERLADRLWELGVASRAAG